MDKLSDDFGIEREADKMKASVILSLCRQGYHTLVSTIKPQCVLDVNGEAKGSRR